MKERAIIANINPEAVDTTGFFDEIALSLGENYKTLSFVSNQIKYVQKSCIRNEEK